MDNDQVAIEKLKRITIISLIFMTVQIAGGLMADSIAILADAFHLLSDVLAYVISLQAVIMAKKPATQLLTFGYQKIQPLGALINVSIIWIVTFQLVIQSTHRIVSQQTVQKPIFMLLTAVFGLLCNLYIMKTLHADPGHHHDCGHHHNHEQIKCATSPHEEQISPVRKSNSTSAQQIAQERKFNNINIEAAYIHILSDIILSIGVIVSAIVIFIWADNDPTKWTYIQLADPFCTYLFSVVALYSTIPILKESFVMLLDGCDNPEKVKFIKLQLENKNYIDRYELKLWSVNRETYYSMLKVTLKEEHQPEEFMKNELEELFSQRSIKSCIQINEYSQQMMDKQKQI